jgi:hypothetical protein
LHHTMLLSEGELHRCLITKASPLLGAPQALGSQIA